MTDDPAFIWEQSPRRRPTRRKPTRPDPSEAPVKDRIPLREAERRFGVSVSTLRSWARKSKVDAVMGDGPNGRQWMVTPESIAHHLSQRQATSAPTPARSSTTVRRTGPTEDGAGMLVPRDAWDRLMEQLGNLHDAGLRLAEARERAAKAETEASFLRERLAEMREERDELKSDRPRPTSSPSPWDSVRRGIDRLLGRR